MTNRLLLAGLLLSSSIVTYGQDEKLDLTVMDKIRQEGLQRSQVMETAFYLTDVNGPRIQGPGYMNAANYAKGKLAGWGCKTPSLKRGATGAKAGPSNAATLP